MADKTIAVYDNMTRADTPLRVVDLGDGSYALRVSAAGSTSSANVITTATHTSVNVSASSFSVLPANANRKYALIINNSTVDVTICLGAVATLNVGIILKANGGAYEINNSNLYTGAISAIAASATGALAVTEGV